MTASREPLLGSPFTQARYDGTGPHDDTASSAQGSIPLVSADAGQHEPVLAKKTIALAKLRRSITFAPWLQNALQGRKPWASSTIVFNNRHRFFHFMLRYSRRIQAMDSIWQPALLALLVYDIQGYYRFPDDRYGNTFANLLSGFAPNPDALSTHWGSDNLHDTVYWIAPLLIIGVSVSFGFGLLHWINYHCRADDRELDSIHHNSIPFLSLRECARETLRLQSLQCNSTNEVQALFDRTFHTATRGGTQALRAAAIDALARFADSFDDPDRAVLNQHKDNTLVEKALSLKQSANRALTKLSTSQKSGYGLTWRARYRHWQIGRKESIGAHLSFGLWTVWQWFSQYRFWLLLITKLFFLPVKYERQRRTCLSEHKTFAYLPGYDVHACGICTDWAFAPFFKHQTAQTCFDALMQQPLPVDTLTHQLERFAHFAPITHLDLRSQPWASHWNAEQLMHFLNKAQSIVVNGIECLDVSTSVTHASPLSVEQSIALSQFMAIANPAQVNLDGRVFAEGSLQAVLPRMVNVTTLSLSKTGLNDTQLESVLLGLKNASLTQLLLSDNNVTESGVVALAARLPETAISTLVLRGNPLSDNGLLALVAALPNSSLKQLDLSEIPLGYGVASTLFETLPHTTITHLSLQRCQLAEWSIEVLAAHLPHMTLTSLDLSENAVSDLVLTGLVDVIPDTSLEQLSLAQNEITALGLNILGECLPNSRLLHLDVSDCQGTGNVTAFFTGVMQSSIEQLDANRIAFDALTLDSFISALTENPNANLTAVSLADNALGQFSVEPLMAAIANNHISTLTLNHNGLDDAVMAAIAKHVPTWPLHVLDVSHNPVQKGLIPLAAQLPSSLLNTLLLAQTDIDTESALALTVHSISPNTNAARLTHAVIPRAQRRALMHVKATTPLKMLDVTNTAIGERGQRALLRVSGPLGITVSQKTTTNHRMGLFTSKVDTVAKNSMQNSSYLIGLIAIVSVSVSVFLLYRLHQFYRQTRKQQGDELIHRQLTQQSVIGNNP